MECDERIDKSQWLPPKSRLISRFRLQHGDLTPVQDPHTGRIIGGYSRMATIVDMLVTRGFVEQHQQRAAMVFMDLHRAYEASQGVKWGHTKIAEEGADLTPGQAADLYDAIRHELGLPEGIDTIRLIKTAVYELAQLLDAEACNVFRTAFEELERAMEAVDKKHRDENK